MSITPQRAIGRRPLKEGKDEFKSKHLRMRFMFFGCAGFALSRVFRVWCFEGCNGFLTKHHETRRSLGCRMRNGWNTVAGSGDCPHSGFSCRVPRRIGSSPLGRHPTHRIEHRAPHGRRTSARGTDGTRRHERQFSGRPFRERSREIFKAKALSEPVRQIDAFRNLVQWVRLRA